MNDREQILKQIRSRILMINENIRRNINSLSLEGNFDQEVSERYFENEHNAVTSKNEADKLMIAVQDLEDDSAAEIQLLKNSLTLKVKKENVCSELSLEGEDLYFTTKKFYVDTTNFKVAEDYVYMKGILYANSGNIGGWEISGNSLVGAKDADGNPAAIDGGTIEALSASGKQFFFETLDFNPEYNSEEHTIDLSNASIAATPGQTSGMPTSFGDMTIIGAVQLSDSLSCGDLDCTGLRCMNGSGSYGTIYCDEIITQDESFSDRRLKEDIRYMDIAEGRSILRLRPVRFTYKKNNRKSVGFIAQEVMEALPGYESIVQERKGYYGIAERQLIPLIILQLQDNMKRLKELRDGREENDADRKK